MSSQQLNAAEHVMLCCIMLCYVMLYYVMLRYVTVKLRLWVIVYYCFLVPVVLAMKVMNMLFSK